MDNVFGVNIVSKGEWWTMYLEWPLCQKGKEDTIIFMILSFVPHKHAMMTLIFWNEDNNEIVLN